MKGGDCSLMQWLKRVWGLITLVVLVTATVGIVVSSVTHADMATVQPPAIETQRAAGEADGDSAAPGWTWEWQRDVDPAQFGAPAHLR